MDERAEIDGRTYADSEMFPLHSLYVAYYKRGTYNTIISISTLLKNHG